ncbi:MAG: 50S ribosomal protein L2 [archaeon]|nr:50S ribosomal protein L2 [archaeon]
MGKRIIVQARGHGSLTYRVRKQAFIYRLKCPKDFNGEGEVIKLLNSTAHTCPVAKIKYSNGIFYIPAFKGMVEGQKINFSSEIKDGNITQLKNIPIKTYIYNIESRPFDGGVFVRTGGNYAMVNRILEDGVYVLMPSKKEKRFNPNCRAIIGVIAGEGRKSKPFVKAGSKFYLKKSKNKLWPRTSAVKMNIIDHPFGSGRGKNPKSKIAKRNVPPGAKVGLIRPSRTGRKKK